MISDEVILDSIRGPIRTHLIGSDTYRSLISPDGGLRAMFGFHQGTEGEKVDAVIDRIIQEMTVKITKRKISGTVLALDFDTVVLDYTKTSIFNMPEAIITTDKGTNLRWLEWLLLEGSKRIIQGFHVVFVSGIKAEYSRSGAALMFRNGTFGVPLKHSGMKDNNWITRALSDGENEPKATLKTAFQIGIETAVGRIMNA